MPARRWREKLATLKPAFDKTSGRGTLTAGNSTPLTDGASACLLSTDEWAEQHGHEVLCHLRDAQVAAVDFVHGEGLLMAPTVAVAEMLKRNNLTLQDFDFYEIHEAFAAQVLCTLRAWEDEAYCKNRLGLDAPPEPLARYGDGEVRIALLDPTAWRSRFAPSGESDCARLERGFEQFQARQRQFAAVLAAHGIPVNFVHCADGSGDCLR